MASQVTEFLWQHARVSCQVREKQNETLHNVTVLGNKILPAKVEEVLNKGPKYSYEPRKQRRQLLAMVRTVANRAAEDDKGRLVGDGVASLKRTLLLTLTPVMSTRVYINVDLDPFCAELVFPKGLDVGGFVSLIFGRFTQEAPRGPQDHGVRHISLQSATRAKFGKELPLKKKVFISVPYGERNPLCTLRDAPLPDDLEDIPDASDEEAVDDVILGSSKDNEGDRPPSRSEEASPTVVSGLLCPSCGGWFSNTEVLQLHKAMSHARVNSNKPVKTVYGCKVCKKTYSTSSDCLLHKWKHKPESEWPFQCKNCSRGFIRQAAFVRHQQTHNFECKECNRNFMNQEKLQEHSVTHQQGRETFLCVHCEQLFLSKAGLERHVLRYHKNTSAVSTGERVNEADGVDPETAPEKAAILDSIPVELSCDQCTFGCSQASELAQHVASNHPTVPIFRCKKCEQPFLKEAEGSLTKHKRTHDFANATKCPHCSKEFATLDYMRNHERLVHTRNFKFSCRLCGHKFPNERKQQTHMAVVHEQELTREELNAMTRVRHMRCPDCSFATYSSLQFRQHRATHTGRYPFSCTLCDRAFTFRFQLTLHMRRQHRPGGPLMCPHCPRHFIAEDSHRAHVALHGAPHAKGLECTQCKRLYETPRLLEKHQASVHSSQATRFTCKVCNKRFRTSSGIVAHRRVAHLDSHGGTNEKTPAKQASSNKNWAHRPGRKYGCSRWKYSCEPCGRFFKFDGSLRAHRVFFHGIEGKTTEEKLCPECGKAFQTELSLAMHLRTHTQEVNFKCSVCSKIYRSRCSLKKHIATAHRSSLRVFCAVCNRGFLSHASMLLHVKFAHKVVVPTSTVSSVPHMGAALTVSSVPHVATAPTVSSIPGIAAMSALSRVPNEASVSTMSLVPGIAAVTTVSLVPSVASVSTVSSAACVAPVLTVPPVPEIVSYTVTASDNTAASDQDMEAATDSVALPSPSMTSDGMVELEPVQEITELTRMEPGSHEHAAVEHLFASIQHPTASLPVVADGPPLTVVGSAQHMLHMLSVSQVEEVVSEVCLPQNSCPNVW
ncbi:hypothetical protein HPB52_019312 [Rhipicephalus sanguineus]|uniref:C2H2-type domain-containing protein n=1 Tax=Rhipicephalus sanguineus TaxID=34632 RepID=A0A9D4Q854_RHISA|nr:hypothetical protein HPB52_019312 [Rhipicephalus sanguineus]